MSLSQFLDGHHEDIIREFATFAGTLMPPGAAMNTAELRDHAEEILTAIVRDMTTAQSHDEQSRKSMGLGTAQAMAASGRLHADARLLHGFSLDALLAEFRALRATVLRLYEASGGADLDGVRRFNESVDEALTVSMTRYSGRIELLRDQFIGILGHDLRNPLGAITTGAALLALPDDHPQRRARVASRILASAQRMQRMIADLLDLARARLGGTIPLNHATCDLQQVCEEVILECREAHPGAVLDFEKRGNLVGEWDADRLAQVVSNLVGNAIQHGDGKLITLVADGGSDTVALSVHNDGIPIPAAALPFIFEPLSRANVDAGNAQHSIGLGLFIARAVVAAHQGEIHVTSSAGQGTTFEVRLPRQPVESAH